MNKMKFIDLCAGIGGFRLGLTSLGLEPVYSCEIDDHCKTTYEANFDCQFDTKDIADITAKSLPKYNLLCAGFPGSR